MLVIISDLHLGDGTTAESIPASGFHLFAKRLRQDAHFAWMRNGKYHTIEELDVLQKLATGEYIEFDRMHSGGERVYKSQEKIPLRARFHYMVGNHDWY